MEIRMHKTSLGKIITNKTMLWLLFRVQILCLFIRVQTYCLHVLWGKYASYLKSTPYPHPIHIYFVDFVPKNTLQGYLNESLWCGLAMSSIEILWLAIIKIRHNDFKRKKIKLGVSYSTSFFIIGLLQLLQFLSSHQILRWRLQLELKLLSPWDSAI